MGFLKMEKIGTQSTILILVIFVPQQGVCRNVREGREAGGVWGKEGVNYSCYELHWFGRDGRTTKWAGKRANWRLMHDGIYLFAQKTRSSSFCLPVCYAHFSFILRKNEGIFLSSFFSSLVSRSIKNCIVKGFLAFALFFKKKKHCFCWRFAFTVRVAWLSLLFV